MSKRSMSTPSKRVRDGHSRIVFHGKFQELSQDIITEIIVRLPIKALLKFKSVSKSWYCLISSSQFVETHLEKSKEAGLSNWRILSYLLNRNLLSFELQCRPALSFMSESCIVESITDCPGIMDNCVILAGSVNGLVLVVLKDELFLWNPSTRVFRELPDPFASNEGSIVSLRELIWGFGFNNSDGNYKVVGIFCLEIPDEILVVVYSLKTNSWKMIESFKGGIPLANHDAKYLNGKLHYQTEYDEVHNRWSIISLDLNTETYGLVEQPSLWELLDSEPSLGLLGGCISVVHYIRSACIDVWILREYGMKDSWTKLITIPYQVETTPVWFDELAPLEGLCMLPNGEIILANVRNVITYHPETLSLRHHQPGHLKSILHTVVYIESLVSPTIQGVTEEIKNETHIKDGGSETSTC